MNILNEAKSINSSNILSIAEELKYYSHNMMSFIEKIGKIKDENAHGSFLLELKNTAIKGVWLSGQTKQNIISSITFSTPSMGVKDFISIFPDTQKKYNPHDEETALTAHRDNFLFVATLNNNIINRLSIILK